MISKKRKLQIKRNCKKKHENINNSNLIRKALKGTVVDQAVPCVHEGSLENFPYSPFKLKNHIFHFP